MEAGLVDGGKDEEGYQLYIGTNDQWNRFEKLKELEEINDDWKARVGATPFGMSDQEREDQEKNNFYQ